MKGHFARLISRAVPPRDPTPVARESTKVHDPFEQVAAPEMPESFPEIARRTTSSALAATNSMVDRTAAEKRGLSPVPPVPPATTADGWQSELSAPLTPEQGGDSPPPVALKPSKPLETIPIRKSFDEAKTDAENQPPKLIHPEKATAARSPPNHLETAEEQKPILSGEHDSNQEVADPQPEQAILLRKADAFMNDLFRDRTRFQSGRNLEEESEPQQAEGSRTLNQTTENPQLKPAQEAEVTHEPDTEQPSLVIGKLTVEVTPPTSPPAAAQPQRIVVRGPMSSRSGLTSSRRFGLGQF
jgi:hypothetical protein